MNKMSCKWFSKKSDPPDARHFSQARCQDELRLWYFIYRWLVFIAWLSVVLDSFLELSHGLELWAIYLTNWDLTLGLVQAFLGAILVVKRWKLQRNPEFDASEMNYGKLEKIYWFFYIVTSSLAIGVTVSYWSMVYVPGAHPISALNILSHVFNSVLMLLDFFVAGVPFEIRCFWWILVVGGLYILFSVVYYFAGGLDLRGTHKIYDILDWERPGMTLGVCAGVAVFLVLTHCLLCFFARFRDCGKKGRFIVNSRTDLLKH